MTGIAIDQLIGRLAAGAAPVRRLSRPWWRAAYWLSASVWVGLLLSFFTDFDGMRIRMLGASDMWMSEAGAVLTAVLAAWAAFETAVPGRARAWALLPVPALLLWVGASGAGCLRMTLLGGVIPEPPMHGVLCLTFLLLISAPLSALLIMLLLRACPLRPGLTAMLAGTASAAASCVLLSMIHPFDATVEDLAMHLAGVAVVLAVSGQIGRRWL